MWHEQPESMSHMSSRPRVSYSVRRERAGKWPDTGVSTERGKPVSCHLLESRVSILKRKLLLATTTLRKTWCASATKASATLTTTENTVWNRAGETTNRSAVSTTASPSSTYTTWPGIPPLPTSSWSVSTGWLVEHLRSAPLKMPALKPQPPKAKLCQVTTPLAPLTLVRLSLVCRLWCRSWGSLRYSGGAESSPWA